MTSVVVGERVTQTDLSAELDDDLSLEDDNDLISSNGHNVSFALSTSAQNKKGKLQKIISSLSRMRFEWKSKGFIFGLLGHILLLSLIWFFVTAVLWAAPVQRCADLHQKLQIVTIACGSIVLASLAAFISSRCHLAPTAEDADTAMELALLDNSPATSSNGDGTAARTSTANQFACCIRGVLCYAMIVTALVALALASLALLVRMEASASAGAPIDGRLSVPGLRDRVYVKRDPSGVIHIDALNQHDMFFAQGFVMAQQRLFQMELTLHAGRGLLSQALGRVALDVDREMRTLGMARLASRTSAFLAQSYPKEFTLLEAFCRGVNEYISQATLLPVEFALTGIKPRQYHPADVLLLCKLMAIDLAMNPNDELRRWRMVREGGLTREEVDAQWPSYAQHPEWPFIVPLKELNATLSSLPVWLLEAVGNTSTSQKKRSPQPMDLKRGKMEETALQRPWDTFWGRNSESSSRASNNWVVGGRLTASGKPLLASDPHLHWQLPSLWMLMHLHDNSTDLNAVGAVLAGAPGVIIGRNEHIAWGITNVGTDVIDLIEIEPVKDRPGYYWHAEEARPLRYRTERIAVKNEPDLLLNLTLTDFGPVMNAVWDLPAKFPMFALRWVVDPDQAGGEEDTTLLAMSRLLHAQNFSAFREAMHLWTAPASNIVYGDIHNNIGYQCTGRTPLRPRNSSTAKGDWPQQSRTANLWSAFVPPQALPHILNPQEGFILSANNAVAPPEYPVEILNDRDWEMGYRAVRIRSEIERAVNESKLLGLEDMRRLQMDQISLVWDALRPLAERMVALPSSERSTNASVWLRRLLNWNGDLSGSDPEALLFERWFVELNDAARGPWSHLPNEPTAVIRSYVEEPDARCGGSADSCARTALVALQKVLDNPLPTVHEWRQYRPAIFAHALFEKTPLACAYNRIVPYGGDPFTVSPGASPHATYATHGASYRHLVDLGALEQSLFIVPGGQSENVLSNAYDNLLPLWSSGQFVPMQTRDFSAKHSLRLEPPPNRPSSGPDFVDQNQGTDE